MKAAGLLVLAAFAVASASDYGLVENQAVSASVRGARFKSSVSVPTTFEAINCKPDGDSQDPRKITFDVNGNTVKVTVWRKKDPSKPKVVGTLVVPTGTVHLDNLLVPTTDVLTEMVYKLKLKDASVFDKDGKEKKEASFTVQLNLLAENYDAMAKALCPVTGGKCGDRAFVGNVLRTMYQQLMVDEYNGGKGSCRGTGFVSGAFIFEDEQDGSMCERLLDAGAYTRASSHKIPGCTKPNGLGSCIAWGIELMDNRMTALAEPITADGQIRVWKGDVDPAEGKKGGVDVRNKANVRLSNHLLMNCFKVAGKPYVYLKPEEVGTLAADKLTHGINYLKTKVRDIGGGAEYSRQEAGEPDRFKLLKTTKAALDADAPKAAEAGSYQVYAVLDEVKKAKADEVDKIKKTLAKDLGVADNFVDKLLKREDGFTHRLGKEVYWTKEEAKALFAAAEQGADEAALKAIKPSSACSA